jgi:putative sterol carrier protein
MTDATKEFFDKLARRGHEPLLAKVSATLRFDLADGKRTDHWLVALHKGDVAVTRENIEADCVVRTDKALFNRMLTGEVNAMAALLRGSVGVEGNIQLLVLFQRLLPGREATGDETTGYARRQS